MKDNHLISFKIFCQRRKFSLYEFLLKNKVSYQELQDIFRNKLVTPPTIDLYNLTLKKIKEFKEKVVVEAKPIESKPVKVNKPKRRRRSKKNEQAWLGW